LNGNKKNRWYDKDPYSKMVFSVSKYANEDLINSNKYYEAEEYDLNKLYVKLKRI